MVILQRVGKNPIIPNHRPLTIDKESWASPDSKEVSNADFPLSYSTIYFGTTQKPWAHYKLRLGHHLVLK
jgi:hypothetical protein